MGFERDEPLAERCCYRGDRRQGQERRRQPRVIDGDGSQAVYWAYRGDRRRKDRRRTELCLLLWGRSRS